MSAKDGFVDIHCHLLPGIDDGAQNWDETLAMAKMAVDDGITTIIATPHQLGNYETNTGDQIRKLTAETRQFLLDHQVPLRVLPGADVRIEDDMVAMIRRWEVLTLGDHGRHVLLELPHELYFPLEPVLNELARFNMVGILSHPERNQGLLARPEVLPGLVDAGCLMQVTAGSLVGTFGPRPQQLSEWMLSHGLVHIMATDAHSPKTRRPKLARAYRRVAELQNEETASALCCEHPAAVAAGRDVPLGRWQNEGQHDDRARRRRAG
ncbi:MAG: CpsB/CapC family capsule biosynthesis tyrosine phosphatase [Pirellulaceae bacterium]|nr:hypothetical protein [Planctomycetales bacterium]